MGKAPATPPEQFKEHRIDIGMFFCDICGYPYPIDQMRIQTGTDGISQSSRVGVNCCFEPTGSSIDRDLLAAFAAEEAARLTAKEVRPPEWNGETYAGTSRIPYTFGADGSVITQPSFVVSVTPDPIVLARGGSAVSVILEGNGFVSGDVISYGSTGITDAAVPTLDSSEQRTLSVQASVLMSSGIYSFTFNGTVWPNLFDVR